jgi:hypothetical protein
MAVKTNRAVTAIQG